MSNNVAQTGVRELPVIIQIPEGFIGSDETIATLDRLSELVNEMREVIKNGFGPVSWEERELADYFGISLKSMKEERLAGKIGYKRVKGKIHYSRRHVEAYLNSEGR
jgi:hypothetical protein